ncbi:PilZ domain-containing protein [bacterium]|nr:PilZ domain-containing protein [bacterium]
MKLDSAALYSLRNKKTGHVNVGYTLSELKAYLTAFGLKEKFDWYFWCAGWESWEPVSNYQELLGNIHREMADPPEFTVGTWAEKKSSFQKNSPLELRTVELNDIPDLEIEGQANFDKRAFDRVDKKLKVKIKNGDQTFRTYTVDVSAGGLLLVDSVPMDFDDNCMVQVKKIETNQAVEIQCKIIMVAGKRNRISFKGFDSKKIQKRFYYWLIS